MRSRSSGNFVLGGRPRRDAESHHSGSPTAASRRCVYEAFYERVSFEHRVYLRALNTFPSAVNQPHFRVPASHRFLKIVFHYMQDVTRLKAVQIDRVLDLELYDGIFVLVVHFVD